MSNVNPYTSTINWSNAVSFLTIVQQNDIKNAIKDAGFNVLSVTEYKVTADIYGCTTVVELRQDGVFVASVANGYKVVRAHGVNRLVKRIEDAILNDS